MPRSNGAKGFAYQAKIKRRGSVIKTKTFRTKTAAREWARRLESDLDMEAAFDYPGRRVRFDELCAKYVDQYQGRDHHRMAQVRWWNDRLGSSQMCDSRTYAVTWPPYREGSDRMPAVPRKPATANRMKAAISALFTFGIKQGLALKNPARSIPSETEHNHRIRYLSDEERARLLDACRASSWDKLYLLVLMALMTGARKGELLGIHWESIDLRARLVTLESTKNGQPRVLTLPMPVVAELLKHHRADGLVFARRRGQGSGPTDIKGPWGRALALSGVSDFRFHDLRHSAASYLAMGGASLLEVAEVLGHRSLQTTKRYAHLSVSHKQKVTDALLGGLGV